MPNKIEPDTVVHVHDGGTVSILGAQVPGVLTVTAYGKQIPGCRFCCLIECGCAIIAKHKEGCAYRRAATCAIPFPCELHGRDTCPVCDKCDCKAS